jgi:methyl-accepting chemotaxis protein
MTVAATNSPAQRDAIRPAAVKRSLQPIRHANRRAQAAAVVRDFASVPSKRSPQSFGDIVDGVQDGIGNAVDAVVDGANQVVDAVGDGINQAVDAADDVLNQAGDQIGTIVDSVTGDVLDFVDAVRIHRLLPLIDTDHTL